MKLNLGAGSKSLHLAGYWNLDVQMGDSLFPLFTPNGGVNGSFESDSADEVRASHVLEHFPHGQTLDVLREWVRVLKPGGWLKIAVPDFDYIVRSADGGFNSIEQLQGYLFGGQIDENDYHKALFTEDRLSDLLAAAGLTSIQNWTSEIQDCASLPVSLNLMGQKPEVNRDRLINSVQPGSVIPGETFEQFSAAIEKRAAQFDKDRTYKIDPKVKLNAPPFGELKSEVTEKDWAVSLPMGADENGVAVNYRDLEAKKLARPLKPSPSRTQVFAAGRWQDLFDGANIDVADEAELAAANAGQLQTRTIVSDGKRAVKIALCLSTPRQGFLRPFERLLALAHQASISVFSGDGVFWHHALSRSIRNAVEFDFEDGSDGFDFILTADYDTYAVAEDIKALTELLARSPEADCIVPMQMKRGGTGEILAGGQNMDLTKPLVPIETGHFGLTIFRKSFFERMPKPWFYEKPDAEGHWGEGRIDADIGFWLNAKKAKLNVMLAPGIVAGHGEELITYPRIVNGKPEKVYQAVNDWLNVRTKPEGIGVQ